VYDDDDDEEEEEEDGDDDASAQPNMLLLDTNVTVYVNVVICLMVVASIGTSLPSHSA
jgi:hypothetical protein